MTEGRRARLRAIGNSLLDLLVEEETVYRRLNSYDDVLKLRVESGEELISDEAFHYLLALREVLGNFMEVVKAYE